MPVWIKIFLVSILGLSIFSGLPQPSVYKPESAVIYHGDRNKKVVALTFDACMTPKMKKDLLTNRVSSWYNKDVIKVLREKNIPATLFLTGMWAEIYPEATRDLGNDPLFEIGNHSYSHPGFSWPCFNLGLIPNSSDSEQIDKTQKILTNLTGKTPHYFRFPGGCFDNFDVSAVHNSALDIVEWDVTSGDAFNTNADSIVSRVLKKVKPGSIVVMHMIGGPNAPETAKALPAIIGGLQKEGFSFVKISDLLK